MFDLQGGCGKAIAEKTTTLDVIATTFSNKTCSKQRKVWDIYSPSLLFKLLGANGLKW